MPEIPHDHLVALLQRIQSGDPEAEQELFVKGNLLEKISMIVRHRIQDSPEAQQELVSDIVMSLLLSLRKGMFDPEKGSLGTYAYGVARNKIRNYYRPSVSNKRQGTTLMENHLIFEDNRLEKAEVTHVMERVLKNLAPKYQEVIIMRYYEELSVNEIARRINLTPKQVYSRIHYGLELIRSEIDKLE
ncbi:MAG: sigma-70 family RNA polymerase sigma factor [Calditrichaeota bacterium]|nr:sigma-70 family RNA polymerase sigma factor [Calditrichota bacterium]MCB0305343.1 sigma-70 family RNA polymerase sigma factor [Calditrichota bacterium]MCB9089261.1 sigma-70 family RNA polymerase sigma factor [Calditrichia bacterium]